MLPKRVTVLALFTAAVFVCLAGVPIAGGSISENSAAAGADSRPAVTQSIDPSDGDNLIVREQPRSERAAASAGTIERTQTLRLLPDEPGHVEGTVSFEIPDSVTALRITLPSQTTVRETRGFQQVGDRKYEWTSGSNPSITYAIDANETENVRRATDRGTAYVFADAGEWALVRVPQFSMEWNSRGGATLERDTRIDGSGATGGEIAFLGEYEEYRRTERSETIRLIVPGAADMEERPDVALASLANASASLHVGAPNEESFFVVAPSGSVEWATRGIQLGPDDAWVVDYAALDRPDNVWLHEYVHTRQDFTTTRETRWLTEATAEYYAALLAFEQGHIEFDRFQRHLSVGTRSPFDDAILQDPDTWMGTNADYAKGGLVTGELDRQIRVTSGRERAFASVFRSLNEKEGAITTTDFENVVERHGDASVRRDAVRYTTTSETPEPWSAERHVEAFDTMPAAFEYTVPDDELRVAGAYRDRTVDRADGLVVDEMLHVAVTVSNVGGTAGRYNVSLRLDGESVDYRTGRLDPGEETTVGFERAFTEPGTHVLRVGDERWTVTVDEPAAVRVRDLEVSPTRVEPGGAVTITATVENRASIPAAGSVDVYGDGERIDSMPVVLDVGEETTISLSTSFDSPGPRTIRIDGVEPMSITVVEPDRGWRIGSVSSMLPLVAVGLFVVTILIVALRRR